jgi:hypothetical protein
MRNIKFASLAAISILGAAPCLAMQAAAQEQPPVVQTQANPPGEGMPSDTPPNPPTANTPVPPAMPTDPAYHAGPYKGALTPAPAEAMDKAYPPCTSKLQDSCVNRSEAGIQPAAVMPRHRAKARRARHSHRH